MANSYSNRQLNNGYKNNIVDININRQEFTYKLNHMNNVLYKTNEVEYDNKIKNSEKDLILLDLNEFDNNVDEKVFNKEEIKLKNMKNKNKNDNKNIEISSLYNKIIGNSNIDNKEIKEFLIKYNINI
jgi:hypothetical protein